MPIYEYKCVSCGKKVEKIQKFSDPPLETCPECSGRLEKLLSHSSFHLKGTGWYVTDYARRSGPPADTSDHSTSKSSASTGTESAAGGKSAAEGKSSEKATTSREK